VDFCFKIQFRFWIEERVDPAEGALGFVDGVGYVFGK
jgi:hypothetical protein